MLRVAYRVRQFLQSVQPQGEPVTADQVIPYLNPPQMRLFLQMSAPEQRHGVAVLRTCQARGHHEPSLLQAALLHDVGKTQGAVHIWHRVAATLLRACWPPGLLLLAQRDHTFSVLLHHAELGADMAAAARVDPSASALIRNHHQLANEANMDDEQRRLLKALQAADDGHEEAM